MTEAERIATKIIDRANDGYHQRDDYPPYAVTPWDDRLRWSDYLQKIATIVIAEEMTAVQPLTFTREEVAAVAGKLTKAQRRILIAIADQPASTRRGYPANGNQRRSVHRLQELGLIFIEEHGSLALWKSFRRDRMWLRPESLGLAVRDYLRGDRP